MARDPDAREESRELRLEGGVLVLAGGVLVAVLLGAFELGRIVERRSAPPHAVSGASAAEPSGEREPEDATENLTFFDTLASPGAAEPGREATAASPRPTTAPVPASAGSWFVQVFVGRDRSAAEEVVRTLRGKGYPVRAEAVREGASASLFKVRVGGFPTKEAADAAADRLHKDGQSSTWVVKAGS